MSEFGVLVVDDEPAVAAAHGSYVQRVGGFRLVGRAGSVREALPYLPRGGVDLVLLDLNLPDGNGLDIVRVIRGAGRPVDILAITAAREVDQVRAAVSLGVVGYLLKPFAFADLRARLEAYLRYRQGLAGPHAASQELVDAMLRELQPPASSGGPVKGLSREVLDQVVEALRGVGSEGASASEVAAAVGISRVTARRYLQHLAETHLVDRTQRLGGSGRPEVLFRWR